VIVIQDKAKALLKLRNRSASACDLAGHY
jgi:hypothetical protein